MVQNLNTKIALILALLVAAIWVLYSKEITLGLDLSGGSSLRYKLPDATSEETDSTIEVFRKRTDSLGIKEIQITKQGTDEVLVSLPGMEKSEVENIVQIIQSQGNLEWFLVAENETDGTRPDDIFIDLNNETKRLVTYLKEKEAAGGWDLSVDLTPLDVAMEINGRDVTFRWVPLADDTLTENKRDIPEKNSTFESLRARQDESEEALASTYFRLVKIFKDEGWRFGGKDLISVHPSTDKMRMPAVGFTFSPARAGDFGSFTKTHIKKNLAIVLDGRLSTDPVIQSELPGGGIISGPQPKGFTVEEQKSLITILKSGSISVKPVLLSRHDIGPTLGENSIERGRLAGIVGLASVFVFISLYYFLAGIVACLSLAFNLTILMAIIYFMDATLTLPGIAGLVLTVGMAVDANILIFERIREEKEKGKTIGQSIKNGFERAFVTIVDANATTFITAFILFYYGTGPIKGFALILMYGIVTSLLSALFLSKVIFALMLEKGLADLKMLRLMRKSGIPFLSWRKRAAVISLILIVAGLAAFISEDKSKYGLDFTGGYNVHLVCAEGTTQAEVQQSLGAYFENVQVISVNADDTTQAPGSPEIFNVKIKSTALGDEAQAETAEKTGESGEAENSLPSDAYLARIREIMGARILQDPISNLRIESDLENESTKVNVRLHFVTPPATDEQIASLSGDDLTKAQIETVKLAMGDFMECGAFIFSEGGSALDLAGVYKRSATVTPERFTAGLLRQLKQAENSGLPVNLSDPFPMTDYIGPTVGVELRDKAIIAIFFSLVAIIVYIRLRFKEYKYGFAACIALVHDVLITLGAVAAVRMTGLVDIEIDLPIIAAFLTIIGYSLNDTIVVFDRIRENLPRMNRPFGEVINVSINQTLRRTILTSLTTLLVVSILFGINYGQRNVLEGFSFAMIIGVLVGTYSSIFVASPVLFALNKREEPAK
jgi:SecD/SecF fusion protein